MNIPECDHELSEIRERAAAATPGPWEADCDGDGFPTGIRFYDTRDRGGYVFRIDDYDDPERIIPTLRFIAAARHDVPRLLGTISRLRRELEDTRARWHEDHRTQNDAIVELHVELDRLRAAAQGRASG